MDYNEAYEQTPALFGDRPEALLVDHLSQLDPALPILDVGSGQGRNCLYLARRGYQMVAMEPSRTAADSVAGIAERGDLPVRSVNYGTDHFDPGEEQFGGVLLFGLIQILAREQIGKLVRQVSQWSLPGASVLVTAFTTRDPGYPARVASWRRVGKGSFCGPAGEVRTYLEPGELPSLFPGFEPVHLWEGIGPEHRHGPGLPERHGMVEAVLKRIDG